MLLMICTVGHATHNRAGQILYKHISGYTYEFTVTIFYYTRSPATRQRIESGLTVTWGDNTSSNIPSIRQEIEILPDDYTKVNYRTRHTFPSTGVYTIVVDDPNRNFGVLNIPNSDGVQFGLKTILRIDPNTGHNTAPELLTYPIDKAAVGRRFVHNPSAYDVDGDSLSYELTKCLRERGIEIETYAFPEASGGPDSLYVNPVTGDFVWHAPVRTGLYNVAMKINEWRNVGGRMVQIGSIVRDIQIEVVESDNRPPELPVFRDTCVLAGTELNIPFIVTDPDNDPIVLTATGGPFQVTDNPATLTIDSNVPGRTDATFNWKTDNAHVRKQPYTVVFKAEDQNSEVKLVSFANYNITVIAPQVENLTAVAEKKEIRLEWNPHESEHVSGYEIYRSIGSVDFDLGTCETGIPTGLGYERVATLAGINNTLYRDNNNGRGLSPGIEYCYRVVAIFSDGAKSLPSDEACASLLAGTPPMIQAHVEKVDDVAGEIHVAWLEKPTLEKIDNKPPESFEYRLYYTSDMNERNWELLATKSLSDTTYVHTQINTKTQYPYYYKVELWDTDANAIVDEDFEIASTLYPILQPSDRAVIINFGRYTPWVNDSYEIYRCSNNGDDICIAAEWVGRTNRETYADIHLKNGQEYCYRIESKGYRHIDGIKYENVNWSHVACVTPFDNVPPCPPELRGETICEENRNQLDWTFDPVCMDDVEKYLIYFSFNGREYERIASTDRGVNSFSDDDSRVGFFYVTAVDYAGNESPGSNIFISTPCNNYELPNVFTPNNDGINDVFKSYYPKDGVPRIVDIKIFNRHGKMVFKTNDPDINWDGRDMDSKRFASTGVYYYVGELYEEWPSGQRIIPLAGLIHLYYGKDAQPYVPPIE